jgi:hypothetical protein
MNDGLSEELPEHITLASGQDAGYYLGELLAVIHRDGGHYREKHGDQKSCEDAIAKYYALLEIAAEVGTHHDCRYHAQEQGMTHYCRMCAALAKLEEKP